LMGVNIHGKSRELKCANVVDESTEI